MMAEILFYITILLANIMQGITGFAGTILAMPFSLRLVGMDVAVPVLNALGLASGICVLCGAYRHVDTKILKQVLWVMIPAVLAGLYLKQRLSGSPRVLYFLLGAVTVAVALVGLYGILRQKDRVKDSGRTDGPLGLTLDLAALLAAGLVHGMFVCGGPILIGYMTRKLPEKAAFRATISTVWIFLNGIIFLTHLFSGGFGLTTLRVTGCALPFLFGGMALGGFLYKRMSQHIFIMLTHILLLITGISLFFK